MKFNLRPAILFTLIQVSFNVPAGTGEPAEFIAAYDIHTRGMKVAEMQRRLSVQENGDISYRSETATSGLASIIRNDKITEESIWHLRDDRIIPKRYEYRHTRSNKNRYVNIVFDWDENRIINLINDSSWMMPAEPGMLDKLLYQYAIMRDLDAGEKEISYLIADGGKKKVYDFRIIGEEILETPIGNFRALKLVRNRPDSDRETIFWCAPEIGHLPIRIEHTETSDAKTVVVISSLSGLGF